MFDRSTEYKNLILVLTSWLFIIWGKAFAVSLMFLSIIIDWALALAVEGTVKKQGRKNASVFLVLDLLVNAFLFVVLTRNSHFSADSALHLRNALIPVGAAFYTLKNFSYVFDVFSGKTAAERNIFCLITYCVSYPFLLAGPVVRYGDVRGQIRSRTVDAAHLSAGLTRFSVGFAKTLLVVPALSQIAQYGLYSPQHTAADSWLGMISFFGEAYFTFMGLSDMGTGIAQMNGFDVGVNYTRINVRNMLGGLVKSYNTSTVTLLSDMRFGGKAVRAVTTLIVALLGAALYAQHKFIFAFAAVIGLLLAAETLIGKEKIEKIPSAVQALILAALSMLLFSCFAFENLGEWKSWFASLFARGGAAKAWSADVKYAIIHNCLLLAIALISVSPLGFAIDKQLTRAGDKSPAAYGRVRVLKTVCTAALLVISYIILIAG
jgi:alginate O-acetyltransferase complex protein AlgI